MKLREIFGKNLKLIRESKGLTQQEFAELCDLNTATIGMFEIGKRTPSFSTIELLAEKLEISGYELFDSKDYYSLDKSDNKLKKELGRAVSKFDNVMLKYMINTAILVKKTFGK